MDSKTDVTLCMDSEGFLSTLRAALCDVEGGEEGVNSLRYDQPVTGGLVNKAALFTARSRHYFVKWNPKPCAMPMFETEARSLSMLEKTGIFRTPTSIKVTRDNTGNGAIHVMEYLHNLQSISDWSGLGTSMARLHSYNSDLLQSGDPASSNVTCKGEAITLPVKQCGADHPPYIGHFTTGAVWRDSWQEYFVRDIMGGLMQLAEEKYQCRELTESWSQVQHHLHKLLGPEPITPQLLHGDFCVANCGQTGERLALFDPSCFYGDPDFDLVIARFEGGFHEDFFTSYKAKKPLCPYYDQKMLCYKLFYNLVMWCHVDNDELKSATLEAMRGVQSRLV